MTREPAEHDGVERLMKPSRTSCIAVVGISLFCVSSAGCDPLPKPGAPPSTQDDPATAASNASGSGAEGESDEPRGGGGMSIGRAGNTSSAAGGVNGGSSGQGSSGMGEQTSSMAGTSGAAAASR